VRMFSRVSRDRPSTTSAWATVVCWACCAATAVVGLLCAAWGGAQSREPDGSKATVRVTDLATRPGIEVIEFCGPDLANDIYCLTLDPHGHPTVAGRGYIKVLLDDNGDLRADRALLFSDRPRDGAMGLLWEGAALYVTGDGGIYRFWDRNGDHIADGPPELLWRIKTGGEHDAHAIRKGPDGCYYVVAGNFARVDASFATDPGSPIREPVAGCVLRFSPDWSRCAIIADGFRNAYDIAFNSDGELFTFDSDNERCVGLPWYEPTRVYHVVPGGHYGWQAPQKGDFWRMPPWFCDVVPPLTYAGRGSPTGVESAADCTLPGLNRRDILIGDWTFGRILHVQLVPHGASYRATIRPLIWANGGRALAVTDLVVAPSTGYLWFCTGGRGTRGAVYVARPGASAQAERHATGDAEGPVYATLRRRLERALGGEQRSIDGHALSAAIGTRDAVLLHLGFKLLQKGEQPPGWRPETNLERAVQLAATASHRPDRAAPEAIDLLVRTTDPLVQLVLLRALQIAAGNVPGARFRGHLWEGYASGQAGPSALWATALEAWMEKNRSRLARRVRIEAARTVAILGGNRPAAAWVIAGWLADSASPLEQEHYLFCLTRLDSPALRGVRERLVSTFVRLPHLLDRRAIQRDRNWPLRIQEALKAFEEKLAGFVAAVVGHADFASHPDHVIYCRVDGAPVAVAARKFYARLQRGAELVWSAELVELLARLSDEDQRRRALLAAWNANRGVRDAVLLYLAPIARMEDLPVLVGSLRAARSPRAVMATVRALRRLQVPLSPELGAALLSAWRNFNSVQPGKRVVQAIREYLTEKIGREVRTPAELEQVILRRWPSAKGLLGGAVMWGAWRKRLNRVRTLEGDATRGKRLFENLGCHLCHSGARAVGPDLRGVAKRFSFEDLFRAIVLPDEVVPDRYRATVLVTKGGKILQGIVVYDSVAGLVLQTSEGNTLHVSGKEIEARYRSSGSIMPRGLLDGLSDQDLADLYAYLKAL